MNLAKVHFWQLAFLFLLLTMLVLGTVWSGDIQSSSDMMTQMMGGSMGDMMKMMHASNITLVQLFWWKSETGMSAPAMEGQSQYLKWVHTFSTNMVFLFTPLILCGAILLLIVWHC